MSGGGPQLLTMHPDDGPLNGDANHLVSSPVKAEVEKLLNHDVDLCKLVTKPEITVADGKDMNGVEEAQTNGHAENSESDTPEPEEEKTQENSAPECPAMEKKEPDHPSDVDPGKPESNDEDKKLKDGEAENSTPEESAMEPDQDGKVENSTPEESVMEPDQGGEAASSTPEESAMEPDQDVEADNSTPEESAMEPDQDVKAESSTPEESAMEPDQVGEADNSTPEESAMEPDQDVKAESSTPEESAMEPDQVGEADNSTPEESAMKPDQDVKAESSTPEESAMEPDQVGEAENSTPEKSAMEPDHSGDVAPEKPESKAEEVELKMKDSEAEAMEVDSSEPCANDSSEIPLVNGTSEVILKKETDVSEPSVETGEKPASPSKTSTDQEDNESSKNSLSMQNCLKSSAMSDLVKKAVSNVKRTGSCSDAENETSTSRTETPPLSGKDFSNSTQETVSEKLEGKPEVGGEKDDFNETAQNVLEKSDSAEEKSSGCGDGVVKNETSDNLPEAQSVDTQESSGDQKSNEKSNCDNKADNVSVEVPESMVVDEETSEKESTNETKETKTKDGGADEEEMNEDELLMELDSEKCNEADKESEPDVSLLNSDHEDQVEKPKTSHNDSSVIIMDDDDDDDVKIERVETPSKKPPLVVQNNKSTAETTQAETKTTNGDVTEEKGTKNKFLMSILEEDKEKVVKKKDKPIVEDVNSDYEVMEISVEEVHPSSPSVRKNKDDSSKDSSARKRSVTSGDGEGSVSKRTKLDDGDSDAKLDPLSRASTPDSVVCLPYTESPKAKEGGGKFKPFSDGPDKKLISDRALAELIRIKLNQCLMREIEKVVAPLRKRVNELQASNEAWKSQASELQKKILELNIALQRKERKKRLSQIKPVSTSSPAKVSPRPAPPTSSVAATTSSSIVSNQITSGSIRPVLVTNTYNKTVPGSPVLSNNIRPIQIQNPSSQFQAIQLPVTSQMRNVVAQPAVSNVRVSTTSGPSPAGANILQYSFNRGVMQGHIAGQGSTPRASVAVPVLSTAGGATVLPMVSASHNTVREMLHSKRETQPAVVMVGNTPQQSAQNVQKQPLVRVQQNKAPNQATTPQKVVVDLTDDDDNTARSKTVQPTALTPANTFAAKNAIALRPTAAPAAGSTISQAVVPMQPAGITLQPGTLQPGTQFVLNSANSTPVFFQQLGQQMAVSSGAVQAKPQTFIYTPSNQVAQTSRVVTLLPQQPLKTATVFSPGIPNVSTVQTTTNVVPTPQVTSAPPPPPPPPVILKHPAPLPTRPMNPPSASKKKEPPKPALKISRVSQGIVLSWNMQMVPSLYEEISSYQLFAYQETSSAPSTSLWKKVGDVKALPLPMACTLTQFQEGNRYHFAVRALDTYNRIGPFSDPSSIHLTKQNS